MAAARFYFDLGDPQDWLTAERFALAGEAPEFVPMAKSHAFRCAAEIDAYFEDVAREAQALGVLPLRRPPVFPADTRFAMLAATYARQIGKVVAFSLAAFRQAYNGGRDLADRDTVLLAGAAAEIHPAALLKGAELRSTAERLERAGR